MSIRPGYLTHRQAVIIGSVLAAAFVVTIACAAATGTWLALVPAFMGLYVIWLLVSI